jgi:hypothetical protein
MSSSAPHLFGERVEDFASAFPISMFDEAGKRMVRTPFRRGHGDLGTDRRMSAV